MKRGLHKAASNGEGRVWAREKNLKNCVGDTLARKTHWPKTTFDKCVFQWYTLAETHSSKLFVENIS